MMPSIRRQKTRAGRSIEADILADIENMETWTSCLAIVKKIQAERDLNRMTRFSNVFDRNEYQVNVSVKENHHKKMRIEICLKEGIPKE